MNYKYYLSLLNEARSLTEEKFIGEMGYPADIPLEPDAFLNVMHIIYVVANEDFRTIIDASHMKMIQLAKHLNIPYRTLQDWKSKERTAPQYVIEMIGYILITQIFNEVKENGVL